MENPLTEGELEIRGIAEASYALRLCNDDNFSVYYQKVEMEKELNRLSGEIYAQKYKLIEPYLPRDTDGNVANAGVIPVQLPTLPSAVKEALRYLDEQYKGAAEIARAEVSVEVSEMEEEKAELEGKIGEWFKRQIGKAWLGGRRSVTLSGCTLTYTGGNVTFRYEELEGE